MSRSRYIVGTAFILLLAGLLMGSSFYVRAQEEQDWSEPVNLSQSGSASDPVVVAAPDGSAQAFWWDQFEGLTTARYDGEAWGPPASAPILITEIVGEEAVFASLEAMPHIQGDGAGGVHAWWLGAADQETGAQPLLHSRLTVGGTTWSEPDVVAESALDWHMAADPTGLLHLIYVRPQHTDAFPAGVYGKWSGDGGASWSAPTILYETIYFRLLSEEDTHVWISADAAGMVYATWDDRRKGQAFLARSTDGGATWEPPQEIGDPEEGAIRARGLAGPGGEALLLWEADRAAAACALYQQRTVDGGATWGEPERVLEDLGSCPQRVDPLRTPEGYPLLTLGSGSGGLTLIAWDGVRWSTPHRLGFSFEDQELGRRVYLDELQVDLTGGRLMVVGQGQAGEIWSLSSLFEALPWAFAPPSPWSEPVMVAQGEGIPGLPAVAGDGEGRVHVLWSEAPEEGLPGAALAYARLDGERWTQPAEVIQPAEGKAEQPSLVAVGEQLHAVWSGGPRGEILYSRAYVRDAYAAGGWSDPISLPAPVPVGGWPAITADLVGGLHVLYVVPLNEGRGVYYTTSDDGGETWSEARVVFDAEEAGWDMVTHPTLVVDEQGVVHAAWVHARLPGSGLPQGIVYARSLDRGETWLEPVEMVEGTADWPRLAATLTGQVHLLWAEVDSSGSWQHRWSTDGGGGEWTRPSRVRGADGIAGRAALLADGTGGLHLVGLGEDDVGEPALRYLPWNGEQWGDLETVQLDPGSEPLPGAAAALRGPQGWLDVLFRLEAEGEEGGLQPGIGYVSRSVPPVEATPVAAYTPRPTVTPTPGPVPTPTATPRPTVSGAPPPSSLPMLEMGPISLPFFALGGILLAALIVVIVLVIRSSGRGG